MKELDLHGYKVHNAWKEFTKHIAECFNNNIKHTTVITGHGKMSEEIMGWAEANQHCKSISRSHNTGAFIVYIRKNKSTKKVTTEKPKVDLSPLLRKFGSY